MILAVKQYKWLLIGVFAIAAVAAFAFQPASAASTDNLSGFAWNEHIGWISFNDTNPPTGGAGYGVKVSATGALSGYAWANPEDTFAGALLSPWMAISSVTKTDNIGWLSFNSADTLGCPASPCQATLNKSTGEVTGWARFVLKGELLENGWVHLGGTATNGSKFGVRVSGCQWSGYAWSADFGWINFSSTSGVAYGVVGSGDACVAAYNYSIDAPTAITVVKAGAGSVYELLPVAVTKTAGSTNELVAITSITVSPVSSAINPSWPAPGASCTPVSGTPCTATGIIDVGSGATAGTYTLTTNTRSASGITKSDTTTLTVQNPTAFDFSLSRNPTSLTYTAPASKYSDITVTRTAGTAASVNLSATVTNSSGSTVSTITTAFSPSTSCTPSAGSCILRMNVTVPAGTPDGPYTVNVRGVNGATTRNTTVQLCVNFCSTYDFRVDAPSTDTVVTKSATTNVTQNIPILLTKLAGSTNELVTITSVTGPGGAALPAGITEAFSGASCTPTATTPCPITRALTVQPSTAANSYTLTINARAEKGRTRSDTFVLVVENPPAPGVDFSVTPSNPETVTAYDGTSKRSNVVIKWLSPLSAVERVRIESVTFPSSAIASAGINPDFPTTNCLPSGSTLSCTRPLDLTVGAIVPDGTYTGRVCVRSVGNSSATPAVPSTGTRKCGNFTITVNVGNPLANLTGKKSTDTSYTDGPITITSGQSVDLRWTSVDADSCTLSDGTGPLGTTGPSGNYTATNVTSNTTYTLTCTSANGTDTDEFDVNIGVATVNQLSVALQGRLRGSGSYTSGPVVIPIYSGVDLRWTVQNQDGTTNTTATCTLYSTSGSSWSKNTIRTHSFTSITQDRNYRIECDAPTSPLIAKDDIDVDVIATVDLEGPDGCTNCTADQNDTVTVDWDYDGDATECTLSGTGLSNTTVGTTGSYDVDLPSTGTNASYSVSCTGPNTGTVTDTVSFTLNEIQCFSNFNFAGGTAPTAAFILQDNNSQNTFIANVTLNLNGMDEDDLRISYGQIRTDAAGEYVNVTSALGTVKMHISTMRHEFVRSLGGGLSEYRVILTLDNTDIQPVGEFSMTLTAENINDSDCRESKTIEAYLSDQRENFGEQ